jgi:hypothetical protein
MSGIIGHSVYAILAAKAAEARRLPVAPLIRRHFSSYLCGAYLGCDVQTMPAAVCVDSGEEVGHGPSPIDKSPITGGEVRPWLFPFGDREIPPRELHYQFYGRAHLFIGWSKEDRDNAIPLSRWLDYAADAAGDAIELFGPGEHSLAYVLGWITHVAGDGLIKSVIEGINLKLIDGTYTAKNRPLQDLISFNEVGLGELGINWATLLDDLAAVPVPDVQLHYMRCGEKQGRLGAHFTENWQPGDEPLLHAVLAENRRYQRIRNPRLVQQLTVRTQPNGERVCAPELSRVAGGLSYPEMLEAAEAANFRHALWQMGEIIADAFAKIIDRQERLQELPAEVDSPDWNELTRRWSRK